MSAQAQTRVPTFQSLHDTQNTQTAQTAQAAQPAQSVQTRAQIVASQTGQVAKSVFERAGSKLNRLGMYQTMFGTAIGLATHGAIASIVNNLAFPLLGLLFFGNSFRQWKLGVAGTNLDVGKTLGDVVAFVLTIVVILAILEAFPFIISSIEERDQTETETEQELLARLRRLENVQISQRMGAL